MDKNYVNETEVRDSLVSKEVTKNYFKALNDVIQSVEKFMSSIDILIKLEVQDGKLIRYRPVIKDTEIQLEEEYGNDDWIIWHLVIGKIVPEHGCDGYLDLSNGGEDYEPFSREYDDSKDFCIHNMIQVRMTPGGLEEDHELPTGTLNSIKFPLYFYKYQKVEDGVILNVCDKDELIKNHFEIAECIFEEYQ